jgi:hypothetical protein
MKQTSYALFMPAEPLNPGEARAHGEKVAMMRVLPIIAATQHKEAPIKRLITRIVGQHR